MPWKERSVMEERMRFVLRLKDGESMASLCREFGISRVTGYKIYERYKECGLQGLTDRARTPYRYANKLPGQIEAMIVESSPLGALASFGNGCYASCPTVSESPPAAPSTPSWTAMGWLLAKGALAQKPKVPLYPKDLLPMLCGAPITKASSCSGTKDIATPLPSRTTLAVIFCSVKPWNPSRNRVLLPPLSACSTSEACP
jgi:hypothetical protein